MKLIASCIILTALSFTFCDSICGKYGVDIIPAVFLFGAGVCSMGFLIFCTLLHVISKRDAKNG